MRFQNSELKKTQVTYTQILKTLRSYGNSSGTIYSGSIGVW